MACFDQPIEPMTLGNMRELGARSQVTSVLPIAAATAVASPAAADQIALKSASSRPDARPHPACPTCGTKM
jgi:hypothetical protein